MKNHGKHALTLALSMPVLFAGLAGCSPHDSNLYTGAVHATSTASPTYGSTRGASPAPSESSSGSPTAPPTSSLTVQEALTALDTARVKGVPGSTPYHLVHDTEGTHEWEIKVAAKSGSEWTVSVSEDGLKVTGKCRDETPDDDTGKLSEFRIPIEDAIEKAADRNPGQDLESAVTGKNIKGADFWEVTTTKGSLVEAQHVTTLIDVTTGTVSREKREK